MYHLVSVLTGFCSMADNDIVDQIKQFYFSMEDKYYDVLDKLNEKIPVYKIVDPIDKIVPSFMLLLILLFLFLLTSFILVVTLIAGSSIATIHAVDGNGDNVTGVSVDLTFGDGSTKTLRTDAFGRFSFNLNGAEVEISIEDEGYESFNETVTVSVDAETEIVLTKIGGASLLQKTIEIKNSENQNPLTGAQISFRCSNNSSLAPRTIYTANSTETVLVESSCGILTATIRLSGFEDSTRTLTGSRTIVSMRPVTTASFDASLRVIVEDSLGDGISGITVSLFNDNNLFKDRDQTDSTGNHVFDVDPGIYYVKVSDESFPPVYNNYESELVTIEAGDSEIITISLTQIESQEDVGKLFVKFVDEETNDPIENVETTFFKNDVYESTTISGADGTVNLFNADFDEDYSLSAVHGEYVFRTAINLEVINLTSTEVTVIELEKAEPPNNSGEITVLVQNMEQNPISGATVYLFDVGLDFAILNGETDSDGQVVFENMPFGDYSALAEVSGLEGGSNVGSLAIRTPLLLEITLVVQEATVEVVVTDDGETPIEGATVELIDAIEGSLGEFTTDAAGEIEPQSIPWNLKPYAVVSKEDYLSTQTVAYDLAPRSTTEIEVIIYPEEILEDLNCVEDQGLCIGLGYNGIVESTANRRVVTTFEDNEKYILLFDVYAGTDLTNVTAVVRTGLESNLTATDSLVVSESGSASGEASVVKYETYNPEDNYEGITPTDAQGKQVIISFGDLEPGLYSFEVEIFIKETEETDALIEARYGVTAETSDGQLYVPSQSELVLIQENLGSPIICDPENSDCPNFEMVGFIKPSGADVSAQVPLDTESVNELLTGQEYEITLNVTYLNEVLGPQNDVDLTVTNVAEALTISPDSVDLGTMNSNELISVNFVVTPVAATGSTTVTFDLSPDLEDNSVSYDFSIVEQKEMSISANPFRLIQDARTLLSVSISDSDSGAPITDASMRLSGSADMASAVSVPETPTLGTYNIWVNGKPAGDSVYVQATHLAYSDSEVLEVNVVDSSTLSLSPVSFDCVTIEGIQEAAGFENEYVLSVIHNSEGQFRIKTTDCPEKVKLALNVQSASKISPGALGGPITLLDNSRDSLLNECASNCQSKLLEEDGEFVVRARGDKLLGQYDIEIRLAYEGEEQDYQLANIVQVIVARDPSNARDIFSIDNTSFDVYATPEEATITNYEFVDVQDFFFPGVSFTDDSLNKYAAVQEKFENLEPIIVDWTVTASGLNNFTEYLEITAEEIPSCESPIPSCFDCAWICSDTACGTESDSCEAVKNFDITNPEDVTKISIEEVWFEEGGGGEIIIVDDAGAETSVYTHPPAGCSPDSTGRDILDTPIDITDDIIGTDLDTGDTILKATRIKAIGTTEGECTNTDAYLGAKIRIDKGEQTIGFVEQGTGTIIINPEEPEYDFELGTVDLSRIPALNPRTGDFIVLEVETNNPRVEARVERDSAITGKVIGSYLGPEGYTRSSDIPISVVNQGLVGRDYGLLEVTDYYSIPDLEEFTEIDFKYRITATNAEGDTGSIESDFLTIDADGEENSLGVPQLPSVGGVGVIYSIAIVSETSVVVYFKDSRGRPITTISEPPTEVFARTAHNFTSSGEIDTIILIDTSGSMNNEWDTVCEIVSQIESDLESGGFDLTNFEVIGMNDTKGCAEDTEVNWEADFELDGEVLERSRIDHAAEAWGVLGYQVIEDFEWNGTSRKMMVIISDNDPTGTGRGNTWRTGIEEAVVSQFVEKAQNNSISLFFLASELEMEARSEDNYGDHEINDSVELMQWAAQQTGGEYQAYSEDPENEFGINRFVLLVERSLYPQETQYFHVRVDAGKDDVCYGGPTGFGITGENAVPRILTSWDWDKIAIDACDASNSDYVYCDAAQFTTELLKKLKKYEEEVIEGGDATNASELLNFQTYLMLDGYTPDFISDYGLYLDSTFFDIPSEINDSETGLINLFQEGKITFEVGDTDTLPYTGLYAATISLEYANGSELFFVGSGETAALNVDVTVSLAPINQLDNDNPMYYIPIDGRVGAEDGSEILNRVGYGAELAGDIDEVGLYTVEESGELNIESVEGTPLVSQVIFRKDEEFNTLNNRLRGNLLRVYDQSGSTFVDFTPSEPVPILIQSSNTGDTPTDVPAFLHLRNSTGQLITPGTNLTEWIGFASDLTPVCTDFSGARLYEFINEPDQLLGNASTSCETNSPDKAYGFEWEDAEPGSVNYRTIFYVPKNSAYQIANACNTLIETDTSLRITSSIQEVNTNTPVILESNLRSNTSEVDSLADIFNLVKDEYVCISTEQGEVNFWWNPDKVFDDLAFEQASYVCGLSICAEVPESCS